MNKFDFVRIVTESVPIGTEFNNPGGGTSLVTAITEENIDYVRGVSTISVSLDDLFGAYEKFRNNRVTSSDLKAYLPKVYDSEARPAGHSCNCTFLFLLLEQSGLCGEIEGAGVRGDPYAVSIS